jgi:TPR repeat protein
LIGTRTRAALAAANVRGVKLGNPGLENARERAIRQIRQAADARALEVIPLIQQIHHGPRRLLRLRFPSATGVGANAQNPAYKKDVDGTAGAKSMEVIQVIGHVLTDDREHGEAQYDLGLAYLNGDRKTSSRPISG